MPNIYFLSFEIVVSILFLLCFVQARKAGLLQVWQLIAGALFGLLLEWATIQQLQAYEYGRFTLMLGEVPVMVGVAWGVIVQPPFLLLVSVLMAGIALWADGKRVGTGILFLGGD